MITRRLALFRIASASAVAATAAAPVALAAVQPKHAENPTLLRLGRKLEKVDALCRKRAKARADARALYETMRPALPAEMLATNQTKQLAGTEQESDVDGNVIWPDDSHRPPRRYHTADYLRTGLKSFDGFDDDDLEPEEKADRDLLVRLLSIADRYERTEAEAREASGYSEANSLHYRAAYAVEKLLRKIANIPALTPDGITIKARVYEASAANGTEEKYRAALLIGPGLAADICRVLSEGGDA